MLLIINRQKNESADFIIQAKILPNYMTDSAKFCKNQT